MDSRGNYKTIYQVKRKTPGLASYKSWQMLRREKMQKKKNRKTILFELSYRGSQPHLGGLCGRKLKPEGQRKQALEKG